MLYELRRLLENKKKKMVISANGLRYVDYRQQFFDTGTQVHDI